MKVTKEFQVITVGNIDPEDPSQFPSIGWKVSLDGTQLGDVYWWDKESKGMEQDAEMLALVLRSASKAIKRHLKRNFYRK